MPNFTVVGPDGKKWNVPAPEGSTQEDAEEYVLNSKYGISKTEAKPAPAPARVDFMQQGRADARPSLAPSPAPRPAPEPERPAATRRGPAPLSLTSLITEPAMTMVSGIASLLPSYARGLYGLARGESDPEAAAAIRETQRKLTYEPRTDIGRLGLETIRPAAEVLSVPSQFIGRGTEAVTGSKVAGTIAEDVLGPEVLIPGAVGVRALVKGRRAPEVPSTAIVPEEPAPPVTPPAPEAPAVKPRKGRKPKASTLPVVKSPDQVNTQITKSEIELSPDPELEAARIAARDLPENVLPGLKTGERIAPTIETQRRITSAAKELLETGQVKIDPSIPPFLQVANLLQSGRLRPDVYVDILKRNNLTPEEFTQSYVQEVSQAGRTLQILSDFRKLEKEAKDAVEGINTQAAGGIIDDRGIFKRIEDIRRGLMVSQLSTAVRNGTVGVGRSILDTGTKLIDFGIQKATGRINPDMPLTTAGDAFGQILNLLNPKQSYDLTKRILEVRPKEYDEMFRQYNAGVALGGKGSDILGAAEKGVYALNVFNRFQDSVMRSAVFADSVERGMKARGLDFHGTMKSGRMGDIPEDIVQRGVQDAMEFTFSNTPKSEAGQAIVKAIEKVPLATIAIPFPRFLVNSMRFMTEYSPFGPLHLLNKAERAKLEAKGSKGLYKPEYSTALAKSLAGSGLLYGAYALRDSEYAGEKWYELKGEDGKTIDMRPYAPFSAYLFVGDLIKRNIDGTLYNLKGTDITEALAGIGSDKTGLQLVDGLLGTMREDPEYGAKKASDYLAKLGGEYAGTFFIPFQQIRDVMAEFEPEEAKVRRVTEDPLAGPVKAKLPSAGRELPESFSYTNPQPRVREAPALRQVTGVTQISPKNEAEKEMDRLQIKEFEIFKRTGNPEADRLIASMTSRIVNDMVSNVVQSENYKKLSNNQKRVVLKDLLSKTNTFSRNEAIKQMPEEFIEEKIKKSLSKDEIRMLEEAGMKFPEKKAEGGLITSGNIDVSKLPAVRNPDGSYSTVRSMGIEMDGKHYLIPKVVNGRVVSDDEAFNHFIKTGKHLGIFGSRADSDAYAKQLSEAEAKRIGKAKGGAVYTPQEELLLRRYASR